MPPQKPYTFAIRTSHRLTKNCKRVCLAITQEESMDRGKPVYNKGSYVMRGSTVLGAAARYCNTANSSASWRIDGKHEILNKQIGSV